MDSALETELRSEIQGEVRFDRMSRGLYSTDASIYQIEPVGVVMPTSIDDVRKTVRIAAEHNVPILPRGAGTSLSGQTVGRALVLDFSVHLNRVLEIDPFRRLARVQPGVVLDQFNAVLKPHGLQFGPDVATSSRATLGGMIGNNSAGSRSVWYGKAVDHVRELTVELSDGSSLRCAPTTASELEHRRTVPGRIGELHRGLLDIVAANRREIQNKYPRLLRRVSGYNLDAFIPGFHASLPRAPHVERLDREWPDRNQFNLSRLFVGAEGTLGVVTEAVVHLVPLPKERGVVLLQFATIDDALVATPRILECRPSAVELLDRNIVELSRRNLKYRNSLAFVTGSPEALLIVEFSGERPVEISDSLQLLTERVRGVRGLDRVLIAESAEQRDAIWNCRKAGAPLLLGIPGARKPIAFVEDTAVTPDQLAEFTRRFRAILSRHGITGAYYGHASVGCLHIRPMLDAKSGADLAILKSVSDEVAELVREYGGAMTGEHGDGLARSYHNLKLFGPALFAAFRQVKRLFDPLDLMNPGKVAATPSPIEDLRYGTAYRGRAIATHFDFSREAAFAESPGQGFLAAAELCNGSGVCRKTSTGTMCPSFMATRDEEHSTRGRANALRLALTGQLPAGSLTSRRMHDVMELCLGCKACKSECPSNVDVARLKMEFLAHYHAANPPGMGSVILSQAAWINRIGSWMAPVSNWLASLPGVNIVNERLLGIDRRRTLPRFARRSFQDWFRTHTPHRNAGDRGRVALLDDCLTSYCEPHVNRAAVKLLERAGYAIELTNLWCCGRPLLSKGFVDAAKQLARRNLARLDEFASTGTPLLGVEPSCLLTFVDEYPDLFPSDAAERVKQHSFLADAWIADRASAGELPALQPLEGIAVLHGHCQQNALVGTAGTRKLLSRIPNLTVKELDSGCCGMAGSFGYEHYDISQQIGERVLFPAVRQHSGPLLAPGFSCRHQIADATRRTAEHPLELVLKRLPE